MKAKNNMNQTNNSPFFSVLIPNYGYSKFIFECLDSVVNQENDGSFDYEIIMCDQSNYDIFQKLSTEISERYKNKINLFHSDIKGIYKARHSLLQKAKGKYIIFVDSDDFVDRNYLIVTFKNLTSNNCPDMVVYNYYETSLDGKKDEIAPSMFNTDDITFFKSICLYTRYCNAIWRKVFKRSLYNPSDYDRFKSHIPYGEDKIISIPLVEAASSILLMNEERFYHYRNNPDSLMHNQSFDDIYNDLFLEENNGIVIPNDKRINQLFIVGLVNSLFWEIKQCKNLKYNKVKPLFIKVHKTIKEHPFPYRKAGLNTSLKISLLRYKMYRLFYFLIRTKGSN